MILESLISQLDQRFQHEKRARVCLWFDEKGEFRRLLPGLQAVLEKANSAPFVLLEYDVSKNRGQVWLKYQIHRQMAAVAGDERQRLRFVLYVPLSEDRLDSPDERGDSLLDLLEEYRTSGVLFRVSGKRPTLFSVLRQAGVALSDSPGDQRRLYDGGADSMLAKYAAKYADQPAAYWTTQLTPELVQSRLVGDLDQTILDLALCPESALDALSQKGLFGEFLEMVKERYGFSQNDLAPAAWVREFVAMAALTEAFVAYSEPSDFPLMSRVAPAGLRQNHVSLVKRWLRDSEHRGSWDKWIEELEGDIDLSAWAAGRAGRSSAFPHLVWSQWRTVYKQFEAAAQKLSTTGEFFREHSTLLAEQSEFVKASHRELGSWRLLWNLGTFLDDCALALEDVAKADTREALVRLFVGNAARIDGTHLAIRHDAEADGLATVAIVADRSYATVTNTLNEEFFTQLVKAGRIEVPGIEGVTEHLSQALWHAKGKRAVVIVDALRYDCALAIKEQLQTQSVQVQPVLAVLPTVTPVGMTALLPVIPGDITLEVKANGLHPKVGGQDMSVRENRLAFLRKQGADCRDITEVEASAEGPDGLGELLVVFGHDEVDEIGHGQGDNLIRHIKLEVDRLARLVRRLHRWGYPKVHIVTDHGFILLDESRLPSEVRCDKDWCVLLKERFALVPTAADVPVARFPFAWDSSIMVAVPPGLAFFRAEKSFSHGGATLQELVFPHLISTSKVASEKRVQVDVVVSATELQQTFVKVTVRARPPEGAKSGGALLFPAKGRTLVLEVLRLGPDGPGKSVLAGPAKEAKLEAQKDATVNLFFHTAERFAKGEQLRLDIRDSETSEQFPAGGLILTIGRDM